MGRLRSAIVGAALSLAASSVAAGASGAVYTETAPAQSYAFYQYSFDDTRPIRFTLVGDFSQAPSFVTVISLVTFFGVIDLGNGPPIIFADQYDNYLGYEVGPSGVSFVVDFDENEGCDPLLTGDICYHEYLSQLLLDVDNQGDTIQFSLIANVVPEPESWMLMIVGCGLAGHVLRRRRRRSMGLVRPGLAR